MQSTFITTINAKQYEAALEILIANPDLVNTTYPVGFYNCKLIFFLLHSGHTEFFTLLANNHDKVKDFLNINIADVTPYGYVMTPLYYLLYTELYYSKNSTSIVNLQNISSILTLGGDIHWVNTYYGQSLLQTSKTSPLNKASQLIIEHNKKLIKEKIQRKFQGYFITAAEEGDWDTMISLSENLFHTDPSGLEEILQALLETLEPVFCSLLDEKMKNQRLREASATNASSGAELTQEEKAIITKVKKFVFSFQNLPASDKTKNIFDRLGDFLLRNKSLLFDDEPNLGNMLTYSFLAKADNIDLCRAWYKDKRHFSQALTEYTRKLHVKMQTGKIPEMLEYLNTKKFNYFITDDEKKANDLKSAIALLMNLQTYEKRFERIVNNIKCKDEEDLASAIIPFFTTALNETTSNGNILHEAINKKDLKLVKELFAASGLKINVDATDSLGQTALHLAAKQGDIELVALLLEQGADLNCLDNSGNSALSYAIKNDKKELVDFLLEKKNIDLTSALNDQDCLGMLHKHRTFYAHIVREVSENNLLSVASKLAQLYIKSVTAPINKGEQTSTLHSTYHDLRHQIEWQFPEKLPVIYKLLLTQILDELVKHDEGWVHTLELLSHIDDISQGFLVNGDTLLHLSIKKISIVAFQALISRPDVHVDVLDKDNKSPLQCACELPDTYSNLRRDMVTPLLAKSNAMTIHETFVALAKSNNLEMLQLFIQSGKIKLSYIKNLEERASVDRLVPSLIASAIKANDQVAVLNLTACFSDESATPESRDVVFNMIIENKIPGMLELLGQLTLDNKAVVDAKKHIEAAEKQVEMITKELTIVNNEITGYLDDDPVKKNLLTLCEGVRLHVEQYRNNRNYSTSETNKLYQNLNSALIMADKSLPNDKKYILVNFFIAITGLGLIVLGVKAIHSKVTSNRATLFARNEHYEKHRVLRANLIERVRPLAM